MSLKKKETGLYDDTCVKIYDPEKKELIAVYRSFPKAGNRLGLTPRVVQGRCINKERVYSPLLQKEIACRLSAMKPGDEELIEKTLKNLPL